MNIEFDSIVFEENGAFVAHCPQLDISSCGKSVDEARANILTAVRLFLEEAARMGTLREILNEAGYMPDNGRERPPKLVSTESMAVSIEA
ncbi:type II toxin-antitoxin system HicB family antitoxin [bacterium]|nr:type II toxin-antitoxin system HicB family antitoxin [bacterium]